MRLFNFFKKRQQKGCEHSWVMTEWEKLVGEDTNIFRTRKVKCFNCEKEINVIQEDKPKN